jgi:hypothetical protein
VFLFPARAADFDRLIVLRNVHYGFTSPLSAFGPDVISWYGLNGRREYRPLPHPAGANALTDGD